MFEKWRSISMTHYNSFHGESMMLTINGCQWDFQKLTAVKGLLLLNLGRLLCHEKTTGPHQILSDPIKRLCLSSQFLLWYTTHTPIIHKLVSTAD